MRFMDSEIDALIFVTYHPFSDLELSEKLAAVRDELRKPVFVLPGHHTENRQHMAALTKAGVPSFVTPYRACRALAALVRFSVGGRDLEHGFVGQ
jgi:acyl-CoA synthetase (NDP forming)